MPSIQVKNVPDEVHDTLRRRAEDAGQSLQEYLLALLTHEAGAMTVKEVLDRARSRPGRAHLTLAESAAIIRAERDARDR